MPCTTVREISTKMGLHAMQVTGRKQKACSGSFLKTDSPENPRGSGAHVSKRPGPGNPFCQSPGQLGFRTNLRLVCSSDFKVLLGISSSAGFPRGGGDTICLMQPPAQIAQASMPSHARPRSVIPQCGLLGLPASMVSSGHSIMIP